MALKYPDIIESANTTETGFPIARADQISGARVFETTEELLAVYDYILSPSGDNTDNDALGFTAYITSEDKFYYLADWDNRRSSEGWKETGGSSGLENLVDGSAEGSVRGINTAEEVEGTYTMGLNAVAEGEATMAIGEASHAEGTSDFENPCVEGNVTVCTEADGKYNVTIENDWAWDVTHLSSCAFKIGEQFIVPEEITYDDETGVTTITLNGLNDSYEVGDTIGLYLPLQAVGEASHAEGTSTAASGAQSHAEGGGTLATGGQSHAEGAGTEASGDQSHAEGTLAIASGLASHAEGGMTTASGEYSHAEGYEAAASGYYSHAEGGSTTASGSTSHAEGAGTTASGSSSHAEGGSTTASGLSSHAEGMLTTASGLSSHSEGYGSSSSLSLTYVSSGTFTISGDYSKYKNGYVKDSNGDYHQITNASYDSSTSLTTLSISLSDEADVTVYLVTGLASGTYAHSEGNGNISSGMGSHAEGYTVVASGDMSHAEGNATIASGGYSHAEGVSTTASATGSHAEGNTSTASGNYGHAEGNNTVASGDTSHAEGSHTIASGNGSHAGGYQTIANSLRQTVFGTFNVADNGTATTKGQYIEIVGNGTAEDARSNARTLDWDGNEVVAGTLTIGGSSGIVFKKADSGQLLISLDGGTSWNTVTLTPLS